MADAVVKALEDKIPSSGWRVISLGCGIGLSDHNERWSHFTGVDIYDYSGAGYFNEFYQYDVRRVRQIIADKSYDLVLCLDIIEHLEREEGLQLIKDAEAIASKAVAFYTPIDWDDNELAVTDKTRWTYGNQYMRHKSLWTAEDFPGYHHYMMHIDPSKPDECQGFLAIKCL